MTKTFTITGSSILELREKYGFGNGDFYDQEFYFHEAFAKDRPEPGVYEIDFGEGTRNKTFGEQAKGLKKGFEVAHPAVILEAVLQHYAQTKECLLKDYHVRTSLITLVGFRVLVGHFGSVGLDVPNWYALAHDSIGLASSRKLKNLDARGLDAPESSPLDLRVAVLEAAWEKKFNEKLT